MSHSVTYRPESIYLSIIRSCNNSCAFCFNRAVAPSSPMDSQYNPNPMTGMVKEAGRTLGIPKIIFTGGEPFLRYNDLLRGIGYASDLGAYTEVLTNAGMIGATGRYRDDLQALRNAAGIKEKTAYDIARELRENGLHSVRISVDSEHNMREYAPGKHKVPLDAVIEALQSLLCQGFGTKASETAIPRKLKLTTTFNDDTKDESIGFALSVLCAVNAKESVRYKGFTEFLVIDGNPGHKIYVAFNRQDDLGHGTQLNDNDYASLDPFRFMPCPILTPNAGTDGQKMIQPISINYDGTVHACELNFIPIGTWRQEGDLERIVDMVNSDSMPDEQFRTQILMLRKMLRIAHEGDQDPKQVAGQRIREIDPGALEGIRSPRGYCRFLYNDPRALEALAAWDNKHS